MTTFLTSTVPALPAGAPTAVLAGLTSGYSLIVAIGPQNAFVITQGLRRRAVAPVVAVCTLADMALIVAGTAGVGAAVTAAPGLLRVVTVLGAAVLVGYATLAARRALRPGSALQVPAVPQGRGVLPPDAAREPAGPGALAGTAGAVATAAALTFLNPHVYLDTVLLLGSLAAGEGADRWWFAAGAMTASLTWFVALGAGARGLARFAADPAVWRGVDVAVAVVMLVAAVRLLS